MKGFLADMASDDPHGTYSELKVMKSAAGWYIGTTFTHNETSPTPGMVEAGSRESQYFETRERAEDALKAGGWDQRYLP